MKRPLYNVIQVELKAHSDGDWAGELSGNEEKDT